MAVALGALAHLLNFAINCPSKAGLHDCCHCACQGSCAQALLPGICVVLVFMHCQHGPAAVAGEASGAVTAIAAAHKEPRWRGGCGRAGHTGFLEHKKVWIILWGRATECAVALWL